MNFCGKDCPPEDEAADQSPEIEAESESWPCMNKKLKGIIVRHANLMTEWLVEKNHFAEFTSNQYETFHTYSDKIPELLLEIWDDCNKIDELDREGEDLSQPIGQLKEKFDAYMAIVKPCMWIFGGPLEEWDSGDVMDDASNSENVDIVPWPDDISEYSTDEEIYDWNTDESSEFEIETSDEEY